MGAILCSRRQPGTKNKVVVEVVLDNDEFRQLRGEMDDVYLFSEKVANVPSKVSLRGRAEATRYFLIPRQLRKHLAVHGAVSCQRLDGEGKSIFIYVLDPCKRSHQVPRGDDV